MSKVLFNTFQEASTFAKNLAIINRSTISVHRDGDIWWVDDLNAENTDTIKSNVTSKQVINPNQPPQSDICLIKEKYDLENNQFVVKVLGTSIENNDHREIILKYWTWLRALVNGRVEPVNEAQCNFIKNVKLNHHTDIYEYVCITYKIMFDAAMPNYIKKSNYLNTQAAIGAGAGRVRNISNTPVATYSKTDGDNNYE